jgi:multidrug efflux pump subunit AcrB
MKSAMAWMARHHVAANLLMLVFVAGGLIKGLGVKQEVFPEISLDRIRVEVAYPGASPEEIEEGVLLKIEENLSGIDGIDEIRSSASEGLGLVTAELYGGVDADRVLNEVKSEVDRIITFPEEAEKPVITKMLNLAEVVSLVLWGEVSERTLREQAERMREALLDFPEITQLELHGLRDYEMAIEIREEALRRYGLTLDQVAAAVRAASLDLPGGKLRTQGGEILLRTKEKKYLARDYADIRLMALADGGILRLGEVAEIREGFAETDVAARYNGKPAAMIKVFRTGDQKPLEIARRVLDYAAEENRLLPQGLRVEAWNDTSELFESRMDLLFRNAKLGLVLVLCVLGIFLHFRLAFWVMLGIPVSFLGGLFVMPFFDTSINMVSLFAFILVLGIVVDNAIVVGENVYEKRQQGMDRLTAAIEGVQEMGLPVTFSVLTTVAAFLPLAFIAGTMGKFMRDVPIVVIAILLVSLVESLFVLPAHLASIRKTTTSGKMAGLWGKFSGALEGFSSGPFSRVLAFAMKNRYLTAASGVAALLITLGLVGGGIVKFQFMPEVEGDQVRVSLRMPPGTAVEETRVLVDRLMALGMETVAAVEAEEGESSLMRSLYAQVGASMAAMGPGNDGQVQSGGHIGEVVLSLVPAERRAVSSEKVRDLWRQRVDEIPGVESLTFQTNLIRMGAQIDVEATHGDFAVLEKVAEDLKTAIGAYPGVRDVEDSLVAGARELKLRLKDSGRTLGFTETDLARQVRAAFYGAEALRLQIGRNEVKVMVRYPEDERRLLRNLEDFRVRTAEGLSLPLSMAADIEESQGYSLIARNRQKRVAHVTASVDSGKANAGEILEALKADIFPALLADHPGLGLSFGGEDKEKRKVGESMKEGFLLALVAIYVLLAVPLNSYGQPLLIMVSIPFGVVGAIWGHLLMGYPLTMLSMFGIVALSGVVVNNALLLMDRINVNRAKGLDAEASVLEAGERRLRPILLTSLTTFCGLMPMILETSMQARFLIPMAISLGFGILFTTLIILVQVPALYLILEDMKGGVRRVGRVFGKEATIPDP